MRKNLILVSLLVCLAMTGSLACPAPAWSAPPNRPENLNAITTGATSVLLKWSDRSSDEDGFRIYGNVAGEPLVTIATVRADQVSFRVDGLRPETTYAFMVYAYKNRILSTNSNRATVTTQTAQVRVTSPNGGEEWAPGEAHRITWASNVTGGQAQLRYDYNDSQYNLIETSINNGVYSWTPPDLNSSRVKVVIELLLDGRIVCRDRSDAFFTIRRAPGEPAAPTALSARTLSASKVELKWTDASDNENGFKIERRTTRNPAEIGVFTEIATVESGVISYTDENCKPNTTYTYRVRAFNNLGDSDYSNQDRVTTPPAASPVTPSPPSALSASALSATEVELDWADMSEDEEGFRIERRTTGTFQEIATVGSDVTGFRDDCEPDTTYIYRVRAFNLFGNSAYSNQDQVTTPQETPASNTTGQTVLRFYIGSTEYYVQGPSDTSSRVQTMDTAPIISESRTLLPIRYVSEPLGAYVGWDDALDQVTVQLGSRTIVLWINNGTARVNGVTTAIDLANPAVTPIIVPPGRTMLPLRFIAENLGCEVSWNAATKEVTVVYPRE